MRSTRQQQKQQQQQQQYATPQSPHKLKYVIYIISISSSASLVGLIGTYAIIKKYLAEQLHLNQGFLGLLDSLSFVGRIIGFIFLTIYPSKLPKRDYLINCVLTSLFLVLIPLASLPYFSSLSQDSQVSSPQLSTFQQPASSSTISSLMLIIGMILSGISRAYVLIPYLIMLQYFDVHNHDDRAYINYFASLATMGDVLAIIGTSFMISLGFSWQFCFFCSLVVFLLCGVGLYIGADQVRMGKQVKMKQVNKSNQSLISNQNRDNNNNEHNTQSITQTITKNLSIIYKFYSKPDNFFWMLEYSFISIMYYNILMWFPYFFMKLGFQLQSSTISIMYPIFCLVSVFLFTSVFRKRNKKNDRQNQQQQGNGSGSHQHQQSSMSHKFQYYLISLAHLFNTVFYLIMLTKNPDETSSLIYIILVALSGVTQGGPYSQITSSQLRIRTQNNQQTFLAITTCKLLFQVLTVAFMLTIGLLMQHNLESFLYFIVGNTLCTFFVHTWRIVRYGNVLTDDHNGTNRNGGNGNGNGKEGRKRGSKQLQEDGQNDEGSIELVDLRSDSRVNGVQMDVQVDTKSHHDQENHKNNTQDHTLVKTNGANIKQNQKINTKTNRYLQKDSIKQTLLQKHNKN